MSKVAQKERWGASGFTIVELVITIVAGSIVILGVYRLLAQAMWSYNLQEQMTDMYQNATYTIKKLSEEVSQAGGALPDSLYTVVYVTSSPANDITMRVNKKGAAHKDTATITASAKIPVDSGNAFTGLDSVVVDTGRGNPVTKQIDSVKVTSTPDTVYLKSPATISLKPGDVVYAASTARYFINIRDFCLNSTSNVLAENIDSLAMMFYDSTRTTTTLWENMSSVSLYVRARTAAPDKFYKHPVFHDGYRRLALSMNIKLRNRF
jgi:Tfp pilus assembly protein PilW